MDRKSKDGSLAIGQHARFLETARALDCNEDEAAFDEKLKAIATIASTRVKVSDDTPDKPKNEQEDEGPRQRKVK